MAQAHPNNGYMVRTFQLILFCIGTSEGDEHMKRQSQASACKEQGDNAMYISMSLMNFENTWKDFDLLYFLLGLVSMWLWSIQG